MKLTNSKLIIQNSTLLFVLSLFLFLSCNTTDPPSNKQITLVAEDASCTEAWLNLKLENISLPTEVKIIDNDSTFLSTIINSNNTILFIENLLPSRDYTFTAKINGLCSSVSSLRTMDTTSHNFTWETFTFDRLAGSSVLNDIAIIDENDIWVVGEIYMYDSLGNPDPQVYNAVHWDGSKWELKRIMFYTFCNQEHKAPYQAKAVFSFTDETIAITSGSQITYIENGKQKNIECIPVSVNSIWGTSSKDLFVVGNEGKIAHYNGSNWTKIESGTELDIQDICGIKNTNTGKTEIYCTVVDFFSNDAKIIKVINNNKIEIIETNVGYIYSFWTQNGISFYLCGNKLYRNEMGNWKEVELDISSPIIGISGNDYNDIYIIGANRFFSHFNGITWYTYPIMIENSCSAVKINGNIVVVTGFSNSKAAIVVGRRYLYNENKRQRDVPTTLKNN